ncbi:integral membrane protein [Liquorilactobacillus sucicola DSM 21376 = JCM 15457]|uniref:Integral membrane protein n=1 Tax=Liquorilactobacillus sucicola DSM 21376 = JCM 15457 TaxID=1423806 RepID=A0A023CYI3_9LACO|nr:YitT family protein [Liquorilactobacillus sucicola]KRN06690.1 integral membrane protein [Liquorilactobacillus sucicola DSM 21376 = JCM 15457]GAJ26958.1 integral membrane protein [Liquorilactobacillus sucicola DSM 21376 = JCM 15457]
MDKHIFSNIRKLLVAIIYGLLSAIGINLFLSSAHAYSIGVPGIAQLLNSLLKFIQVNVSISNLVIILNVPLVILSLVLFGWNYTLFSLTAVVSNVIFLGLIPEVSILHERLTNTIVGSVIIGVGIGLCFRNSFSTGGTDVIVSFIQQKYHKDIGFVNTLMNGIILGITAIFFGIPGTVYSLISMIVTSYVMDKIYIQQKNVTLVVFTKQPAILTQKLRNYSHGATLFSGRGIYADQETDMILMLIQKNEISFLKKIILDGDPAAFISVQTTDFVSGNYIRRF